MTRNPAKGPATGQADDDGASIVALARDFRLAGFEAPAPDQSAANDATDLKGPQADPQAGDGSADVAFARQYGLAGFEAAEPLPTPANDAAGGSGGACVRAAAEPTDLQAQYVDVAAASALKKAGGLTYDAANILRALADTTPELHEALYGGRLLTSYGRYQAALDAVMAQHAKKNGRR